MYKVYCYQTVDGKSETLEISCPLPKARAMEIAGTLNDTEKVDGATVFFFIHPEHPPV